MSKKTLSDITGASLLTVGAYFFIVPVICVDILPFINGNAIFFRLDSPILQIEYEFGITSIGIIAATGLLAMLSGLIIVRHNLLETVLLVAPTIIFIFSLDFVTLDPTQFNLQVIYWFTQVHLAWITNGLMMYVSAIWLIVGCIVFILKRGRLITN